MGTIASRTSLLSACQTASNPFFQRTEHIPIHLVAHAHLEGKEPFAVSSLISLSEL